MYFVFGSEKVEENISKVIQTDFILHNDKYAMP
jgi:hypothetical protein